MDDVEELAVALLTIVFKNEIGENAGITYHRSMGKIILYKEDVYKKIRFFSSFLGVVHDF